MISQLDQAIFRQLINKVKNYINKQISKHMNIFLLIVKLNLQIFLEKKLVIQPLKL